MRVFAVAKRLLFLQSQVDIPKVPCDSLAVASAESVRSRRLRLRA